jgi:hypothetical protein
MKNFSVKDNWVGLDRLATWDEVCCAITLCSQVASELGCTSDDYRDLESDFTGGFGIIPKSSGGWHSSAKGSIPRATEASETKHPRFVN